MRTTALHFAIFLSALGMIPASVRSQEIREGDIRRVVPFNEGWSYLEEDLSDVRSVDLASSRWQNISLPHTWNRFDAVDQVPGYRRAASWYRRDLVLPAVSSGCRYVLSFEGVNITSEVYVNGVHAGGHVGGYVGFEVDISPFIRAGTRNTILMRVSNAYDPDVIPSQKSDFHIYGGITRDVWLNVLPSLSIGAVRISTPKVDRQRAIAHVTADVRNDRLRAQQLTVHMVLRDRMGKAVAEAKSKIQLAPGQRTVDLTLPEIRSPQLWSPNDPALYTCEVLLEESGRKIDQRTERFGFRWFEFTDHGPFLLNGERLLLRGTHRHEDYAGYANAMPDSLHRRDMVMIKEMGANFVRLAHYPQDPEVYRACDELGILVWDELPWCRGGMGGDVWKANTRRLLREQILQNGNHPSIIIWSLGNEMYWLPDMPGGDDQDSLRSMLRSLNTIAHELDPSRVTATRKFVEGADLVDLVSPSMWPGWYGGYYKGYERALEDAHKNLKRFFHAEYGGDSHAGRHTEAPVSGEGTYVPDGWEENIKPQKMKNVSLSSDWSENYIVNLFDWFLHLSEQTPWLTGNAQWAFKDFPTPLRPENPIPYVNQKGLVDRAGNPKDAYYVFRSYWTTSPEFCYIESHTWTERSGPANVSREVKVFSNCPEVELLVNGQSIGKRERDIREFPACGLHWMVAFAEGKNELIARGYRAGLLVTADTITLRYRHEKHLDPDHIELHQDDLPGGRRLITAVAVDKNGVRCLDYNKRIYFVSVGGGQLLENYGTPTRSSVIEMANGQAAIEFIPVPGCRATIEARNQDFKGAYLVVE